MLPREAAKIQRSVRSLDSTGIHEGDTEGFKMTKRKLPSDMAFPITVSKLQDKLACVPQHCEIAIQYSYYKGMTDRRLQKTKFGKSHRTTKDSGREIMTARYERLAVSLGTPNSWLQENSSMDKYTKHQWALSLRAVPLADLADVRNWLEKEGYAKLVDWFGATNKYAGSVGKHSLTVSFDGSQLTYRQFDSA